MSLYTIYLELNWKLSAYFRYQNINNTFSSPNNETFNKNHNNAVLTSSTTVAEGKDTQAMDLLGDIIRILVRRIMRQKQIFNTLLAQILH